MIGAFGPMRALEAAFFVGWALLAACAPAPPAPDATPGEVSGVVCGPEVRGARAAASVEVPATAAEPFSIVDARSGLAIRATLIGAAPAARAGSSRDARYTGALGSGTELRLRTRHDGLEDLLFFERRPEREEVRYAIELERAAGLRWIGDVVEVVDPSGAPRLRVAPPFVIDAEGVRHAASLAVEGCVADRDPRPPWRRAITPSAGRSCILRVAWGSTRGGAQPSQIAYPAVLDPVWTTTADMVEPRAGHAATLVAGGRVLVTGTRVTGGVTTEVYDPETDSWATTGALVEERRDHVALALEDGARVLVVGGRMPCDGCAVLASAEMWDAATGTFTLAAQMSAPRLGHAGAVLGDGTVLIAGGRSAMDPPYTLLATAEVFDPGARTFATAPPLGTARMYATMTTLLDGTALVVGGQPGSKTAERFDSTIGWYAAGTIAAARYGHSALRRSDGSVIVVGGSQAGAVGDVQTTELFDPAVAPPDDPWTTTGDMLLGHLGGRAALLPDDRVLVVGGPSAQPELFDPKTAQWTLTTAAPSARQAMALTTLPNGAVLVIGGVTMQGPLAETLLFELSALGEACEADVECASYHCVKGICCDTPCDSACTACTAALEGGGADGTCGPVQEGSPDPHDQCAASPGDPCGPVGVCGAAGACALAPSGQQCSSESCDEPGACDGAGTCVCAPACTEDRTHFGKTDCSPYRCDDAGCLASCDGSSECVPPHLCDRNGRCTRPSDGPPTKDGCACAMPRRAERQARGWLTFVLPVLAALVRRRRR